MKHCISVDQFTPSILNDIFWTAFKMEYHNTDSLSQKVVTNLFYEPSTRTSSSFYSAACLLGGSVIPINDVNYSSVTKGETLEDTIMTMAQYSDCIVLRHPEVGAAKRAADISPVPIINAGDGSGEHPTQALLDFYTIVRKFDLMDAVENQHDPIWQTLNVCLMGDLKYGRTVHSLKKLLSMYHIPTSLVSPKSLSMPKELAIDAMHSENIDDFISDIDVLYMTRVQKERMKNPNEVVAYNITEEQVNSMKESSIVMHPLPRNDELPTSIDSNPRASYFQQMKNGLYVRKALFEYMLGK